MGLPDLNRLEEAAEEGPWADAENEFEIINDLEKKCSYIITVYDITRYIITNPKITNTIRD